MITILCILKQINLSRKESFYRLKSIHINVLILFHPKIIFDYIIRVNLQLSVKLLANLWFKNKQLVI